MEFEIPVQDALLECVEQSSAPKEAAQQLKAIALEEGISNIGLAL